MEMTNAMKCKTKSGYICGLWIDIFIYSICSNTVVTKNNNAPNDIIVLVKMFNMYERKKWCTPLVPVQIGQITVLPWSRVHNCERAPSVPKHHHTGWSTSSFNDGEANTFFMNPRALFTVYHPKKSSKALSRAWRSFSMDGTLCGRRGFGL